MIKKNNNNTQSSGFYSQTDKVMDGRSRSMILRSGMASRSRSRASWPVSRARVLIRSGHPALDAGLPLVLFA